MTTTDRAAGTVRYAYRPDIVFSLLGVLLFGPAAVLFVYRVATNDQPVEVHGFLLSVDQSRIYYGLLAAFSALCVLVGATAVVFRFFGEIGDLVIAVDHLIIPRTHLRAARRVTFAEVTTVREREVYGTRIFEMKTSTAGASLSNRMFEGRAEYDNAISLIKERLAARSRRPPRRA